MYMYIVIVVCVGGGKVPIQLLRVTTAVMETYIYYIYIHVYK